MTDILFLIGPTGSGKSTLAREQYSDRFLIEADQFYEYLAGKSGQGYTQSDLQEAGMLTQNGLLKAECYRSAHRFVIEATTCALRLRRKVVLCGAWTRRERLLDIVGVGKENAHF
jgi:predicted kinase